jgi:uncharacterized membrane protein
MLLVWEIEMRKTIMAAMLAGGLSLSACQTADDRAAVESVGTGAAIGGVVGAGAGAAIPGLNPIEGAAIGAAIGGLAGAVWHDQDRDGRADGYYRNGQYYQGPPPGYDARSGRACVSTTTGALGGAAIGGVGGAGVGAVATGDPLLGAVIGAVVGGVAGAVWADANQDGCVDGYMREGQYYQGAPQQNYYREGPSRRGERG